MVYAFDLIEPSGIGRNGGKRLNGFTLTILSRRETGLVGVLLWEAIRLDTLFSVHRKKGILNLGAEKRLNLERT